MLTNVTKGRQADSGYIRAVKEPSEDSYQVSCIKPKPCILYENQNMHNVDNIGRPSDNTGINRTDIHNKWGCTQSNNSTLKEPKEKVAEDKKARVKLAGNNEKLQFMLSQIKGSRNSKINCQCRPIIASY
eukprot:TRINITY_DN10299_c0_g1_i2.p1 TRINITY_DN10299_c0_g1~~TRINITY_DN10299_c0_g1_i2.p1  ORF type:complete len:130 (+),score=18.64 TRINITY_DN10299_c0_g1_i2:194-583(+)